jgi:serine protease Do
LSRRRWLASAASLTFAGAVTITAFCAARSIDSHPVAVQVDPNPVNRGALEPASYAAVAKRIAPSVVKITVTSHRHGDDEAAGIDPRQLQQMDPFFRQFFGQGQGRSQQRQPEETGLGSGVIISSDGYVVTNNHVVDGAENVTVSLDDGRELKARVVGRDPQTDLAVVKIDAKDLPAITFASSAKAEVGDRVLAVGNPFGIGETVTSGIISVKDQRNANLGLAYEDFIQTDAAINPGNSGGALVDVDGRLIGINTAILTRSGGFQGVGLAIPSDLVRHVVDGLVQHGKVVRGYLGISIQNLTPALAENFNLPLRAGVLVTDVQPGTPAAKAGLRSGDVITAVAGNSVSNSGALSLTVSETPPGTKIDLKVLRDGRTQTLTATTESMPSRRVAGGSEEDDSNVAGGDDQGVLNGVAVGDLDEGARQQFDIPGRVKGAVITQVAPDSASAKAGLEAGDVILEINHHAITSADEAVKLSENGASKKTLLKLWSHGGMIYTVVDETPSGAS